MPVTSNDPDVLRLLKALGMPERCTKFVLVAEMSNVVLARATYFPDIEGGVIAPITKTFELVERKHEKRSR